LVAQQTGLEGTTRICSTSAGLHLPAQQQHHVTLTAAVVQLLYRCAGDADAVGALTDAYPQLLCYSNFLQISCWHLAARAGSAEVLTVLISRAEDIKYRHCLANVRRSSSRARSQQQQQEQQQQQDDEQQQQQDDEQQQGSLVQQLVNARTSRDITPLMMAAESSCADSVCLLLQQVGLH
jgi:ankyrin repeat protein